MWAGLTLNEGIDFFDDAGKVSLNTPEMVEANQKYLDIYQKGWAPKTAPTDGYTEIVQNFESGVTGMLVHHLNSAKEITEVLGDDVDVVALPEGAAGRYLPSEPCHWAVSANSESTEEAVNFLKYASGEEAHKELCKNAGLVPCDTSYRGSQNLQEINSVQPRWNILTDVQIFPVVNTWGDWSETVWPQTMQRAMMGEIDSAEMMQILADNLAGE